MQPTLVRIGMMDSRRPQRVEQLPARHLGLGARASRAVKRVFVVTGLGLLVGNLFLVLLPFPHVHLCLFPLAIIAGPIIGAFTWRDRVLLGASPLDCPRCGARLQVPHELPGWPARFNCEHCAIMVELNEARPTDG